MPTVLAFNNSFSPIGNTRELHSRRTIWLSFYVLEVLEGNKFFPASQKLDEPRKVLCNMNSLWKVIYNNIFFIIKIFNTFLAVSSRHLLAKARWFVPLLCNNYFISIRLKNWLLSAETWMIINLALFIQSFQKQDFNTRLSSPLPVIRFSFQIMMLLLFIHLKIYSRLIIIASNTISSIISK